MFFTIAKIWKQPKYPAVEEWLKKLWCIYIMAYYIAVKTKESLLFSTAWMDSEVIILRETS